MLQPNDFEVASPPNDGISGLAFSPVADYLAVSSWDNQIRIYEVQPNGSTTPKVAYSHEAPALCVTWSKDGTKVVSGGGDKAGRMMDINTGQTTQVAQHDDSIRCVKFLDQGQNILATGSWDKTIKYWDLRSPQPIGTAQLPERLYAMDTRSNLLVAGTADRNILLFDLNNPTTIYKQAISPLKWQTREISCFIDSKGYAIGSIEGRVAIQYIDEKDQARNFSFKCHREGKEVYSVNTISFHPTYGTFSTAGGDGTISFWDKDSKQRLKNFPKKTGPIPCSTFLSFLHAKGFIHRDIKCENLLIGNNGEIKLADFGLATSTRHVNRERLGTAKWMAPEVIREQAYNEKVDLWSLGITLIEMMDRVPPHYATKDDEEVFDKILQEPSPTFTYSYPTIYCTGLVAWLLEESPENRPTAKDVIAELDLHIEQNLLKSADAQGLASFVHKMLA